MILEEVFTIEEDHSLEFKNGSVLYLSKINIGKGQYMLELSDRRQCIGRRKAHNIVVANAMMEITQCSIKRILRYDKGLEYFRIAFALEKNIEFVFAMRVYNRTIDQDLIGQLITKHNLKVDSKIDSADENSLEPMKISLTFPGRKLPVGTFVGHFLQKDFVFVPYSSAD